MRRPALIVIPPAGGLTPLLDPFLAALRPHVDPVPIDHDDDATTTRRLARAALARWAETGHGPAHLFGISLGGMVAQWIAADAPDRVRHLVLASTAARAVGALADPLHGARLARCLVRPRDEMMACLADGVLSEPLDDDRREAITAEDGPRRRTLLRHAAAASTHDATDALARIRAPTVVLSGGEDRLIAIDAQADLAAHIEGARHVVLDGVGHDLTVETPQRTANAVLEALG